MWYVMITCWWRSRVDANHVTNFDGRQQMKLLNAVDIIRHHVHSYFLEIVSVHVHLGEEPAFRKCSSINLVQVAAVFYTAE